MNRNPDNNELEQIEQGLEAFLEQEACGLSEAEITADWPDEAVQGQTREFYIKTDMLPEASQRAERTAPRSGREARPAQESCSARDARQPVRGTGQPVREAGQPAREVRQPVQEDRQLVRDTRQPVREVGQPVRRAGQPARDGGSDMRTSSQGRASRLARPVEEEPSRRQPSRPARPSSPQPPAQKKPVPKHRRPDPYERRRDNDWDDDWEDDYDDSYEGGREDAYDDDYDDRKPAPRPKKRRKKKSLFKRLFLFLLILCVLVGGLWYYLVGRVYARMNYEEIPSLAGEPFKEDGVINILLIGNDSRSAGEDGRSDAMILLSISKKTKTIHMMSLLRDMYVDIPGHEGNRLNAAYSFGGPELLLQTLEQNLDLEINRYVQVNFQAFAGVVDAVGGVDLDLTNEEVQYVNGYLTEYNNLEGRPEGTDYLDNMAIGRLHLNGPQALAYCRIRYIGTDFGRTERQREVLSEVISKAPKALLTNPTGLLEGLLPNLTTNLTESECRQLSLQLIGLMGYDLVPSSIPIQGSYQNASIRGMSVLEVDFAANKAYIRENIYGE